MYIYRRRRRRRYLIEVCRAGEIRFHQQRRAHELFYACVWVCASVCPFSNVRSRRKRARSGLWRVRARGLSEKDGCAGSCVREQSAVYKMAADGPKRWGARTRRTRRCPGRQWSTFPVVILPETCSLVAGTDWLQLRSSCSGGTSTITTNNSCSSAVMAVGDVLAFSDDCRDPSPPVNQLCGHVPVWSVR